MQNSILTSPRRQNLEKADHPPDRKRYLKSSVYLLVSEHRKIFSQRQPKNSFRFPCKKQTRTRLGGEAKKDNHLIKLLNRALSKPRTPGRRKGNKKKEMFS
ncbi:hypothetical protein CDAR_321591 [Caerostris darwini]|uniref:Uncharacterized protein n=1 Tax=Caerostris darwini TaxID=1538125 RepID=A0AAV4M785_9ARAC|nr:hypothetical protein CDAR_321591 [Caerostris darwini]